MSEYAKNIQIIEDLWKKRIGLRGEGGGRVTEYIVEFGYEPNVGNSSGIPIGEQIVRCRDCKFADWDIVAWWCTRDKHYPFEIGELRGYGERSHLDGFCAWAERREP